MWLKQFHKPSPSHHHFYRWYVYHSQSWVVYDIVLPTIYHLINILILIVPTSEQKVDSDRLFEHLGEHGSTPHFPDDTRIFVGYSKFPVTPHFFRDPPEVVGRRRLRPSRRKGQRPAPNSST